MVDFLSLEKTGRILKRNSNFIISFIIAGFLAGIFYSVVIFKPIYKTGAALLIKNPEKTAFVAENSDKIKLFNEDKNFLLTRMRILNSDELAEKVWRQVKEKSSLKLKDKDGINRIKKAIRIKNPADTNIIELKVSWNKPEIASSILQSTVSIYKNMDTGFVKDAIIKNRQAIDKKLKETGKELLNVRNKIKDFKKDNSTIDLKLETQNLAARISTLENQYQDVNAKARADAEKISMLAKNLGIKVNKTKNISVINGEQDAINFSQKLNSLQDKLAGLSARYTPIHPDVIKLKSRIKRVEEQIQDQVNLTVGNTSTKNRINLSDPIKAEMTQALIASGARYSELKLRSEILGNTIKNLRKKAAEMPQKQLTLMSYSQQENNLSNIVNTLKTKKVAAEVKELGISDSVKIMGNPAGSSAFPGRIQLICLFAVFSGLLASLFVVGRERLKNNYDDPEQIEKDLNVPVLGVIPLREKKLFDDFDEIITLEEKTPVNSLAYQKAVSRMRIKGCNSDARALAFTSMDSSRSGSDAIMNMAYSISKTGQSVVVADADFRTSPSEKKSWLDASYNSGLKELLAVIAKDIQEKSTFAAEKLDSYIGSVPGRDNFFVIPNSGGIADPGEFLYSAAFSLLIEELKKKYDWVFIDVPPVSDVPDALIAGSQVDGMVIVAGHETNRSVLKKIHRQFENYNIKIFGIITHELQEKEDISVKEYIKQAFGKIVRIPAAVLGNNNEQTYAE